MCSLFRLTDEIFKCLICLDDYVPEDELRLLSCKHAFHKACVDQWLTVGKNNCPACRTTVSFNNLSKNVGTELWTGNTGNPSNRNLNVHWHSWFSLHPLRSLAFFCFLVNQQPSRCFNWLLNTPCPMTILHHLQFACIALLHVSFSTYGLFKTIVSKSAKVLLFPYALMHWCSLL